ncbi:MAG: glycerol-3-phosphate acyltransferase [Clostridium sp.]|nr:glycerol-3-phosphate acyltransferase [Clostridium sp.]
MGYLIGSSSMSYYLGKINNINVSKNGTGNLGASNTLLLMGWKAGIIVAVHDTLKAYIVVLLAQKFFVNLPYVGEVAGIACVIGHIFPFYLKFRGGKGFASYMGMTLALDWKFAVGLIILCALLTIITDYVVTATFTSIVVIPIYMGFSNKSFIAFGILLIGTIVMIFKHRDNIARLRNGTEVGLRSANRGDNRLK